MRRNRPALNLDVSGLKKVRQDASAAATHTSRAIVEAFQHAENSIDVQILPPSLADLLCERFPDLKTEAKDDQAIVVPLTSKHALYVKPSSEFVLT